MRRSVARGRVFPQSYSTDRRYGRLSLKAIGLFPLIWANADDQGRLCGDPEEVKYACCPNIDHITKADVPGLLEELERHNLIRVYETPRSAAIQILDWWDVQKPQWAWPSEYPPMDGWKDRLRYKRGASTVVTENWPSSGEKQNGAQVRSNTTLGESRDDSQAGDESTSGESENQAQASHKITSGRSGNDSQVTPRTISHELGIQVSKDTSGKSQCNSQASAEIASGEGGNQAQVKPQTKERERTKEKEIETEKERGKRKRNSPEPSGERQKGAQVSTQAAKKPPDPFAKERMTVFSGLKERRGYNSPVAGAEAKAITWMLKQGYSVVDILSAYDQLKQDVFWRNKLLNMQSVKAQIGEIFGQRRQHEQREPEGRGAPAHRSDSLQDYKRRAEAAGLTVITSGEEGEAGDEDGGV